MPFQHGFTRGKSTLTALSNLTDYISSIPSNHQSALISFDFSSAFDTISHQAVMSALSKILTNPSDLYLLNIIQSFLTNRSASPSLYPDFKIKLIQGVPQGSILSPTLFNVATYHLLNCFQNIPNHYASIYADDTTLIVHTTPPPDPNITRTHEIILQSALNLYSPNNEKTIKLIPIISHPTLSDLCQSAISSLSSEANHINLSLNKKKTFIMPLFNTPKSSIFPLTPASSIKILGLIFDPHLTFDIHIKNKISAVSKLSFLFSNKIKLTISPPANCLRLIHNQILMPKLTYAYPIFSSSLKKKHIENLDKITITCARLVSKSMKSAPTEFNLAFSKLLPFSFLHSHNFSPSSLDIQNYYKSLSTPRLLSLFPHYNDIPNNYPFQFSHFISKHCFLSQFTCRFKNTPPPRCPCSPLTTENLDHVIFSCPIESSNRPSSLTKLSPPSLYPSSQIPQLMHFLKSIKRLEAFYF